MTVDEFIEVFRNYDNLGRFSDEALEAIYEYYDDLRVFLIPEVFDRLYETWEEFPSKQRATYVLDMEPKVILETSKGTVVVTKEMV